MFHVRSYRAVCGLLLSLLLFEVCVQEIHSQTKKYCPFGWGPYVTKKNELTCTWFSTDIAPWIDAMNWCKVLGGHLVEIGSPDINLYLMAAIKRKQPGRYWIGATDMEHEMRYKWMTSGAMTPINLFLPGQSQSTRAKNCVTTDENAYWTVEDCKAEFGFICQKIYPIA